MTRIRVDMALLISILALMMIGMITVYSSSWPLAAMQFDDGGHYLKRQLIYAGIAIAAMCTGAVIAPRTYLRFVFPMLALAFIILLVVLIPGVGAAQGIARRWIAVGPFTIQAGEPLKFVLLVYLASSLAKKGERMENFSIGVLPHLLVPGAAIVLLLCEPDFGTAAMLATLTLVMLFVGGARIGYLAGGVLALLPIAFALIVTSPYRMRRVMAFLDPWSDRFDTGYQITESLMTLGSGGLSGAGIGASKQKLFFLPEAHTDFIFAVVGEELGFIGVCVVLLAFFAILWRGTSAALRHQDAYRAYLTFGISALLVMQAIFNIAVVVGLVPTKGLTLPFMSYGGSSLIISGFLAGVLLRCAGSAPEKRRETSPASDEVRA